VKIASARETGWLEATPGKIGAVQILTGGALLAAPFLGVSWHWWLLAIWVYFLFGCVGHSVGYHRYFSHRSFEAPRWAEMLFVACGVLGCSGPPAAWSLMHRRHHAYSDREGDSYTAHKHPHLSFRALFLGDYQLPLDKREKRQLRRMLRASRLQSFVHRRYFGIVGFYALSLLILDWRLFVFGWAVPAGLNLWISALDAYSTHHWGYRTHQTEDESRNLWWMAVLFWGEGWHNNHHARPRDWDFRQQWWEFDLGALVIRGIRAMERLRHALMRQNQP